VGTRGGGGFEKRLVEQSPLSFAAYEAVLAGPVVGVHPLRAFSSILKVSAGVLQSLRIIRRHQPQAILLTGGWANVPLAAAAWMLRVPMLVYLPDIEPGRTIQLLSRVAQKIAVTVPDSARYFREGQTITTGYPLREAITQATREDAVAYFGLDPEKKTILVTGGSRGARTINIAMGDIAAQLMQSGVQVIHVSGKLDYERTRDQLNKTLNGLDSEACYHLVDYLESQQMGLAFAAADIIIGRAGASVLGEFPYFGAASILIPYPYAWRYQKVNADWLAERGAAIRMDDERMSEDLLPAIASLVNNEARLQQMQASARALSPGNGADNLAATWLRLAQSSH
jgi:UDP-N-acetylglucosamine--N-acetylmuramyl-(pentapeptide) pyrophosphoryl-undecaprenol N-acetylglucosamine transferase